MEGRLGLLLLSGSLVLGVPIWAGPARGADPPTLKETLGKVQSEAESRAVEDLIEKLKGGARKPPPPAPAATPVPAAPTTPVAAPAPPPAPAPAAPAPPIKADEAVERSALREAPSIDLEVLFPYKSAEVTPEAAAALAPLGRALSDARLAGNAFLIAGHTDAKGSAAYNLALSQQRAEAVRRHLIATFGLDGARLTARGMGSRELKLPAQPLAAENRRVQIVNLSKDRQR
jgi:outer membrane protein OmpA-like peptidoglycan-associated protein